MEPFFKHLASEVDLILRRLGQVLHVSRSQNIILRTENVPRIGETVVDEDLNKIGEVFDIFGPVSSPYVSVRPYAKKPEKMKGTMLYATPSKRRK